MTDSEVCRIESVTVRENGILVDAQHLSRPSVVYRNTPILTNFSGLLAVPQVGQRVVVSKDSTGFEYVDGILTGPDDPAPEIAENEFVLQFDPETRITTVDDGTGGYELSIEASGDVTVNSKENTLIKSAGNTKVEAGGDILLGTNGTPVARQDHTHDYEDTGDTSDGSAGTTSKTTPAPNESGTKTKIQ